MKIFLYGLIIYLVFLPRPAYAYLDPGSGSYILQMLIGLFITFSFIFRTSLKRLMTIIKNIVFGKNEDTQQDKSDK